MKKRFLIVTLVCLMVFLTSAICLADTVYFASNGAIYSSRNGDIPQVVVYMPGQFCYSPAAIKNGKKVLVYFHASSQTGFNIHVWNSRTGKTSLVVENSAQPAPSPNGKYIAYIGWVESERGYKIHLKNLNRRNALPWIPFIPVSENEEQASPSWSADSKMIAFDRTILPVDPWDLNTYSIFAGDPFTGEYQELIPFIGGVGAMNPSWAGQNIAYEDRQDGAGWNSNMDISVWDGWINSRLTNARIDGDRYIAPCATSSFVYCSKLPVDGFAKIVRIPIGGGEEEEFLSWPGNNCDEPSVIED